MSEHNELTKFIKAQRGNNISDTDIRRALLDVGGWNKGEVEEAFSEAVKTGDKKNVQSLGDSFGRKSSSTSTKNTGVGYTNLSGTKKSSKKEVKPLALAKSLQGLSKKSVAPKSLKDMEGKKSVMMKRDTPLILEAEKKGEEDFMGDMQAALHELESISGVPLDSGVAKDDKTVSLADMAKGSPVAPKAMVELKNLGAKKHAEEKEKEKKRTPSSASLSGRALSQTQKPAVEAKGRTPMIPEETGLLAAVAAHPLVETLPGQNKGNDDLKKLAAEMEASFSSKKEESKINVAQKINKQTTLAPDFVLGGGGVAAKKPIEQKSLTPSAGVKLSPSMKSVPSVTARPVANMIPGAVQAQAKGVMLPKGAPASVFANMPGVIIPEQQVKALPKNFMDHASTKDVDAPGIQVDPIVLPSPVATTSSPEKSSLLSQEHLQDISKMPSVDTSVEEPQALKAASVPTFPTPVSVPAETPSPVASAPLDLSTNIPMPPTATAQNSLTPSALSSKTQPIPVLPPEQIKTQPKMFAPGVPSSSMGVSPLKAKTKPMSLDARPFGQGGVIQSSLSMNPKKEKSKIFGPIVGVVVFLLLLLGGIFAAYYAGVLEKYSGKDTPIYMFVEDVAYTIGLKPEKQETVSVPEQRRTYAINTPSSASIMTSLRVTDDKGSRKMNINIESSTDGKKTTHTYTTSSKDSERMSIRVLKREDERFAQIKEIPKKFFANPEEKQSPEAYLPLIWFGVPDVYEDSIVKDVSILFDLPEKLSGMVSEILNSGAALTHVDQGDGTGVITFTPDGASKITLEESVGSLLDLAYRAYGMTLVGDVRAKSARVVFDDVQNVPESLSFEFSLGGKEMIVIDIESKGYSNPAVAIIPEITGEQIDPQISFADYGLGKILYGADLERSKEFKPGGQEVFVPISSYTPEFLEGLRVAKINTLHKELSSKYSADSASATSTEIKYPKTVKSLQRYGVRGITMNTTGVSSIEYFSNKSEVDLIVACRDQERDDFVIIEKMITEETSSCE